MYKYMITYTNGIKELIRAKDPKQASERAIKGIVSNIKWVR